MLKRYNIVTFFYFGVASILFTFYYPFLNQGVGLSLDQVSKVVSFGALFSIAAQPYLSHTFGKVRNKKAFMLVYLGLLAIVNISMFFASKEWIYIFAILYGCFALPLIGTYEIYIEKLAAVKGFEYSKVRKWGSIGLGSVALVGGSIIAIAGFPLLHSLSLVFLALCAIMIYKSFDDIQEASEHKKSNFRKAFSNKHVIVIYIMSFIGLGSYVGMDFAFSPYLTELTGNQNLSNQIFSISTGIKVFLEFLTFTIIGIYLKEVDLKKIFLLVFICSGLRFLFISTGVLPLVVIGDQFHGIAFPLFLVVVFKYLRFLVDDELVPSCYGIVSMLIFGISNFVYPPVFAAIQSNSGYQVMYLVNVGLSIITILIGIFFLPKYGAKQQSDQLQTIKG